MREARKREGLSLEEMAQRVGSSPSLLSRVERGERRWPDHLVVAYRQEFNLTNEKLPPTKSGGPRERAKTYVDDVHLTVVLLANGGCDYYDERWSFRARRSGVHELSIMVEQAEEVRLWSFEELAGGELTFEPRADDKLAVILRFEPLKAGQHHEIAVREYPPSDLDTLTFFVMPDHDIRQLRFTVVVPPDASVTYSLLRIDWLEPSLDLIPLDICHPITLLQPETEVLFSALEVGMSYGIHWDW